MRAVTLFVGATLGVALVAAPAPAARLPRARARTRTLPVVIDTKGTEYEDAQGKVINGSDATSCPPTKDMPTVKAKCWTWRAKKLGKGTYTQADVVFQIGHVTWTFTFTDSHGDSFTGTAEGAGVQPDPTDPHSLGHVNRFPGEVYTITGGTGRFKGATGTLNGEGQSKVVDVDAATGIVTKQTTDHATGTITLVTKR